ncbi:hypothetical protein PIB30_030043 [Stylosanthes scabra]|uniref:Uncharacterized protein n=1 Tax=Stylosanthes scabra TaxID=79078 RepID=A0ABU6SBR0_9FABA|nr:hypothetical protein [Stylosanthes scabra]
MDFLNPKEAIDVPRHFQGDVRGMWWLSACVTRHVRANASTFNPLRLQFHKSLFFDFHPCGLCHPPDIRSAVVAAAPPPHAHNHHPEPNLIVPPSFVLNFTFPSAFQSSRTRVQAPTSNLCVADLASSAVPPASSHRASNIPSSCKNR